MRRRTRCDTTSDDEGYETRIEKIVGMKKTSSKKATYLCKLKGKSYRDLLWMSEKELKETQDGPNLLSKIAKSSSLPTEEPYFDPDFTQIEKIISKNGNKYLVKWKSLGYDQATLESDVLKELIDEFDQKEKSEFPKIVDEFICLNRRPDLELSLPYNATGNNYQNLPILNNLLQDYYEKKAMEIICEMGHEVVPAILSFYIILQQKYSINGPHMIVIPQSQLSSWMDSINETEALIPLVYTGSRENRKEIRELDFFNEEETETRFHILLTTPETLRKDMEFLSKFIWQSVVIDSSIKAKSISALKGGPVISITYSRMRSRASEVQRVMDVLVSDNVSRVVDREVVEQAKQVRVSMQHATAKRFKYANDAAIPKLTLKKINCPLCPTQRNEIRRMMAFAKEDIIKGSFLTFCDYIRKIATHPFIIPKREFYSEDDFQDASTKMEVLYHILNQASDKGQRVLVVTEFHTIVDMVEDLADMLDMSFHRISPSTTESHMQNNTVFCCDQLFTKFSVETSYVPWLCNTVDTVVCIDGDASNVISALRLAMTPNSIIKTAYKLECAEVSEAALYDICTQAALEGAVIESNCEIICSEAVMASFNVSEVPEPEELLEAKFNSEKKDNFLENEFASLDFWGIMFDEIIADDPEVNLDDTFDRDWTVRERNQLVRFLFRFGARRSTDDMMYAGVKIKQEIFEAVTNIILGFCLKNSKSGYKIARSFLQDSNDLDFFDEELWAESSFRSRLRNLTPTFLKRFEHIANMAAELAKCNYRHDKLPELSPTGDDPTDSWAEEDDKALIYGIYKYGFGNYDYFLDDSEKAVRSMFVFDGEYVDRCRLNERYIKLGEALRRLEQSEKTKAKKPSKSTRKSNRGDSQQDSFTEAEENAVRNYLLRFGIPLNAKMERDYKTLRLGLEFHDRSEEEIAEFVENYLQECETAVNSPKESGDEKRTLTVSPSTARKILMRVNAMDDLRRLLASVGDSKLEEIIKAAQDKRELPDEFDPSMEALFFKRFTKFGFGYVDELLAEEPFKSVFSKIPQVPEVLKHEHKNVKRIKKIVEQWKKGSSTQTSSVEQILKRRAREAKRREAQREASAAADEGPTIKSRRSRSEPLEESRIEVKRPRPERRVEIDASKKIPTLVDIKKLEKITFPFEFSQGTLLESLGTVNYTKKGFHTQRYIYPDGYTIVKRFWHPTKKDEKCRWKCEILDDGSDDPLFRVTCMDVDGFSYEGHTPTAPWTGLTRELSKKTGLKYGSVSGTGAYFLSHTTIEYLIQQLPNVDKCKNYHKKDFSDSSAQKQKAAVTPHVTEKAEKKVPSDKKQIETRKSLREKKPVIKDSDVSDDDLEEEEDNRSE